MTEINITEMTKRPREIFTAQFDRYDFERRFKRIYFKNVKNDKDVLIKERFWISESKGKKHNLINNMFEDEVIFFSAEIEMNVAYEDGFKLVRPIILITKEWRFMRKILNEKNKEKIVKMLESGATVLEVAGRFGVSSNYIFRFLRENNIQNSNRKKFNVDKEKLVAMRESGMTLATIADHFGVVKSTISNALKVKNR